MGEAYSCWCKKCGNWGNVITFEVRRIDLKDFKVKSAHTCSNCGSILIPVTKLYELKCKNCNNILDN